MGYSCTVASNTITISNAISSNLAIREINLTISNIMNPNPAVNLGTFSGTIGSDTSVSSAQHGIVLQPSQFESCSITFFPNSVNRMGSMIVTVNPRHPLNSTASILVDVPTRWANDITSYTLELTSNMACTSISSNV